MKTGNQRVSSDEEMFEQTRHVSDGFGGRRYEASRTGPVRQSISQAEAERMGPMAKLQFGRDLNEIAAHGSAQAKRRLKIFRGFITVVFIVIPLVLYALSWVFG